MIARRGCSALLLTSALAGISFFGLGSGAALAAPPDAAYQFDIPAESLSQALTDFSQNSPQQIIFSEAAVKGVKTQGVHGKYTSTDALRILLSGTDLKVEVNTAGVLMVRSKNVQAASDEGAANSNAPDIETVIVTGTHIEGGAPVGSYVFTATRDDIDRSGYATLNQFLQTVPQNFSGGASEIQAGNLTASNGGTGTFGTGANLHGLGANSTLTLLDGERMAPAEFGQYVDLSMVPVSAISRVDVLADGASAIYGADAVGGVVNVVLRTDFDGQETRVRAGTAPGMGPEYDASQTIGREWGSGSEAGNILATYEFYSRGGLSAANRNYTNQSPPDDLLLPDQRRNSALVVANQSITDNLDFHLQALYSQRTFQTTTDDQGALAQIDGSGTLYNFAGSINWRPFGSWDVKASSAYSSSDSKSTTAYGFAVLPLHTGSWDWQSELNASGNLFSLPGGDIRSAVGVQFRRESYRDYPTSSESRNVTSGYAELLIPIVGDANATPGISRLDVSAAVRDDSYSDFGNTINPKFGISWDPMSGVTVRSSYGTSFHAPTFDQLDGSANGEIIIPLPDPLSSTGTTPTLIEIGNNPHLGPERATTWSAGIDVKPSIAPSAQLHLTYFSVRYVDRIGNISPSGTTTLLPNIDSLAPYAFRNPSLSFLQSIAALPGFVNPFNIPLSSVGAFANLTTQNISQTNTDGIDASASYDFQIGTDLLHTGFSGEYLLSYGQRTLASSPDISLLNTVFSPLRFKIRGELSWTSGPFEVGSYLNFQNAYRDIRFSPAAKVASWTTLDLNLAYRLDSENAGWARGTTLSLGVINLFDQSPPYARDVLNNINFDGANANPLGRYISLQLTHNW